MEYLVCTFSLALSDSLLALPDLYGCKMLRSSDLVRRRLLSLQEKIENHVQKPYVGGGEVCRALRNNGFFLLSPFWPFELFNFNLYLFIFQKTQ